MTYNANAAKINKVYAISKLKDSIMSWQEALKLVERGIDIEGNPISQEVAKKAKALAEKTIAANKESIKQIMADSEVNWI